MLNVTLCHRVDLEIALVHFFDVVVHILIETPQSDLDVTLEAK